MGSLVQRSLRAALCTASGAALLLSGCIALAQPEDFDITPASAEQIAREQAAWAAYRAQPYLAFDRDGNGALNIEEWRAREWAFLRIFDADDSGDFTLSEWVHQRCGAPSDYLYDSCSRIALREFLSATGSRSGRVSERDMRSDRSFRLNDANRDGLVTEAELHAEDRFRR